MYKKSYFILFFLFVLLCLCAPSKSQPFKNEKEFKAYLLENNEKLDFIEGIWEFNKNIESGLADTKNRKYNKDAAPPAFNIGIAPYRVAIIKGLDNNFFTYSIGIFGTISETNGCGSYWFKSTAIEGQYIYDVDASCKYGYHGKVVIKTNGDLYFDGKFEENKNEFISYDNFTVTATKLSPTQAELRNSKTQSDQELKNIKPKFSFGTASAISNDLIITCYHVVKDAKKISIRGIDGRSDTTYLAQINYYDEDLDVALLKIQKNQFSQNFVLPYSFKQTKSEVGENIFVLGYPLQNTMGQEIKLTTGVISSNSGFLGDTTLFQISAPIQPGSSGGPLFDNSGNLIGLVTAKHIKADNVGYAFKLSLLKDILKRKGVHFVSNKTTPIDLSKKVKLYKDFIYSIEVSLE